MNKKKDGRFNVQTTFYICRYNKDKLSIRAKCLKNRERDKQTQIQTDIQKSTLTTIQTDIHLDKKVKSAI